MTLPTPRHCVLAMHMVSSKFRQLLATPEQQAKFLVSFRPRDNTDDFKAHKHEWTKLQAESLGMQLVTKYIGAEPTFEESYRRGIRELHEEYGVSALPVQDTNVELVRPLWKKPREEILSLLQLFGISYISGLLGHIITHEFLLEQFAWYDSHHEPLDLLHTVDLAGEYGEMHSMVRDCPLFSVTIECEGTENKVHETKYGSYMYIEPGTLKRVSK
ncbi:hypothetical protein DL89DRAFT_269483 [Linderina pennispora]|uniref:Diphthamide synthase domain-containing protein n=1 Tax=Linderina pennispora TaxID=61395 RepID=A0A1Y1W0L5_9FUNG|nr:uncharacterized protein DL89DRAFT_269483 [Linderina pennispora]ORX67043.1 hypothetical protein DL89DRAFT_269483 [Linderina pennispora]